MTGPKTWREFWDVPVPAVTRTAIQHNDALIRELEKTKE